LPITRYAMEESNGLTAISEYLRDLTIKEFGVTRPVEVIANFVNCDVYKPAGEDKRARRAAYAREDEYLLIHLSNFRPVKRTLDVMELFRRVSQKLPARLLMVGDGPDRAACERFASCHGMRERVSFLGKQESVHELLPLTDLNLMPSELESFGLVALEAMACEVPTIATNVGGVPEVIQHGETGLLYAVGDVEAMANGAVELLKDAERLRAMGTAGRQFARKNFCANLIVPRYEEYYAQVLAGSR
jgi:N-acetyl-alpha-D-glucosaminyl L-malate synthase BshA